MRLGLLIILLVLQAVNVGTAAESATPGVPAAGRELFRCTFEGPFSPGANAVQEGCINNWDWGRKIVRVSADADAGRPGVAQRIDIDEIHSGQMQFFVGPLPWMSRGAFYRVSFWMRAAGPTQVKAMVRKIGNPWTRYVDGIDLATPADAWTRYEFSGVCSTDVDSDHAVLVSTAEPGTIWLDDVVLELLPGDPRSLRREDDFPALAGNQVPRASCESAGDGFWTGGVYGDPDAEWEDPQPRRVEGGYAGRFAVEVPCSTRDGTVFCRSGMIPVAPERQYTVSMWMRATQPGMRAVVGLRQFRGAEFACSQQVELGVEWKRVAVTTPVLPLGVRYGCIDIVLPRGQSGAVRFDAVQVELGAEPTPWAPAHPIELEAGWADERTLRTWGEETTLRLAAWPAAADLAVPAEVHAEVAVWRYPDEEILRRPVVLAPGRQLELPLGDVRGLLRVELRAADPTLAAPVEALSASLPEPRGLGAAGSFGVHLSVRPAILDYARRIGYSWVRCHDGTAITKWHMGEPEAGRYRWFDVQVDALRAAGFAILGLPDTHGRAWPAFARRDGRPAIDPDRFAAWCEAAAAHYRGRIDAWEIWNEPYMAYFWPFGVEGYAAMMPAGIAALRRGNPEAKILGACNELGSGQWKAPLPDELKRAFDIGSYHHYQSGMPGDGTVLREQLATYAATFGSGAPAEHWNSEGGCADLNGSTFATIFGDVSHLNQRAVATASRILIEHRAAGTRHFHYTMHQNDTLRYHGVGYKMMIGYDRSPTPPAVANAITAWAIDGLTAAPLPAPAPDGIGQVHFTGSDRVAWTVFRLLPGRGPAAEIDLGRLPAGAMVVTADGRDPRGGSTTWPLGLAPLFVVAPAGDPDFAATCQAAIRMP